MAPAQYDVCAMQQNRFREDTKDSAISSRSHSRPAAAASPRRVYAVIALVLVVVTVAVYWRVAGNGFTNYDDPAYITANPHVKHGLSWDGVRWAVTSFDAANWHPFTWLSHMTDVNLFGMQPGRHHLAGLAIHIASVLLLFGFLVRTTGRVWAGAFVAALFAVHPLHVESVAWAAERKDVLGAFFWLATMWAYVFYTEKGGWARYASIVVLFALGLMAKPMLVTLPLVLLLLDWWPLQRPLVTRKDTAKLVAEKLPLLALSAASAVVTMLAQHRTIAPIESVPVLPRLANAIVSYARYIAAMFWPVDLAALYPYHVPSPGEVLAAAAVLVIITLLLVRFGRSSRYAIVGWLWYAVTLIPVIGIVQVGEQSHADRYTYIPLIGLFIVVAWALAQLVESRPAARTVCVTLSVLAVGVCGVVSWHQLGYWKDTYSLAERAVSVSPDNPRMQALLATSYLERDDLRGAERSLVALLARDPNDATVLSGLGLVYLRQKRYQQAIDCCLRAVRMKPDLAENWVNAGLAYRDGGQLAQAEDCMKKAVAAMPDLPAAHNELATVLAGAGKTDEAISALTKALKLDPSLPMAHLRLGMLQASRGNFADAAEQFRGQLALQPDADTWTYLGGAQAELGRLTEAEAAFKESIRLSPGQAATHYNYGVVLARMGRKAEAVAEVRRALELEPADQAASRFLQELQEERK
jgi:protein O-mannosyl-transferase